MLKFKSHVVISYKRIPSRMRVLRGHKIGVVSVHRVRS